MGTKEDLETFRCGAVSDDAQQGRKGCIFVNEHGVTWEVAIPQTQNLRIRAKVLVRRKADRYYWEELGFTRAKRMPNMPPDVVGKLFNHGSLIIPGVAGLKNLIPGRKIIVPGGRRR